MPSSSWQLSTPMNSLVPQMLIKKIRAVRPELLDWGSVVVRTLKDPRRPLSIVSDLGVIHAGMEEQSAVHRITNGAGSYVIKQHFDSSAYARETANIAFINALRPIAPEILYSDEDTGIILMEDLGDRSLAHLAINNRMQEYERWVRRAFSLVALIQSHFRRHEQELRRLYGNRSPEAHTYPCPTASPTRSPKSSVRQEESSWSQTTGSFSKRPTRRYVHEWSNSATGTAASQSISPLGTSSRRMGRFAFLTSRVHP